MRERFIGPQEICSKTKLLKIIARRRAEYRCKFGAHVGRRSPKGRDGDRINAVLAAAGYNFGLLLRWLAGLLCALIQALLPAPLRAQLR